MTRQTDLMTLWRNIEQAGSADAYIQQQLTERGFVVERRATDSMSKRELEQYKKQLREEAAEKKRLRREAWAAYKANHIVHVGDGVFWNDLIDWDRWDLEDANERAAENELPVLETPQQLADAMGLTVADLRFLAYHRDAATRIHYRRFTIPKSDGRERAIWAPSPKLKAAQRWILREILERLLVHGSAHGFLPGRSIATGASVHTNSRLLVQMDLADFFPTITFPRVRGVFRRAGYRLQISTLLALLCTESPREIVEHEGKTYYIALGPRCLPQGAPTSPAITNTLCLRLDRRLTGLATKLGWRYTRYADDMTFSLPSSYQGERNIRSLLGNVHQIISDEGFRIHPKKTRISRPGSRQQVTGLVVNGTQGPRVPRAVRRQLRAAIHNLSQGKPLHEGETPATLAGYAAYINMTDPQLAEKLLARLQSAQGST